MVDCAFLVFLSRAVRFKESLVACYCVVASKKPEKSTFFNAGFSYCRECSAVFRDPMPTDEVLAEIYRDCYSPSSIVNGSTDQLSPEDAYREILELVRRYSTNRSAILDVGAGTGGLVSLLKTLSAEVDGVESSIDARKFAELTLGVVLFPAISDVSSKSYDLVTLVEVIEHVTDPVRFLQEVKTILKPGAQLIITTPNRDGLRARLEKSDWVEAAKHFHLHLFNKSSLDYCLTVAGYNQSKIIEPEYSFARPVRSLFSFFLQRLRINGSLRVVVRC